MTEPAAQTPQGEPKAPLPKATPTPGAPPTAGATPQGGSGKPSITYDDFMKLDLRVGVVQAAEKHPNAERLLKVDVDIGGQTRQIIAGIAASYDPAGLVGRRVVVLANLEPKQLRGLTSSGMLLAADVDGKPLLLAPEGSPPPGTPVK
jgi:methionyl-tRNA synthetase